MKALADCGELQSGAWQRMYGKPNISLRDSMMQFGMLAAVSASGYVPRGFPWRACLLLVLLSVPAGASPVTVQDSSYAGFPTYRDMTAHAGYGNTRPPEQQVIPGQFSPADAVIVPAPGNMPVMPLQELGPGHARQEGDSPDNRLLLFFLLLMAAVSGLLIEIATTRRHG